MPEGQPPHKDACIYGVPCFPNTAGVALFSMHTKIASLVMRMPGDVPTLVDGETRLRDVDQILLYLARHYAPEYLPEDPARQNRVTAALETFASDMYPHAVNTIDVSMGFHPEHKTREEALAAGQAVSAGLDEFSSEFLKDTFVGGQKLSIADFRVAPFFMAYEHSVVHEKCGVIVPERIKKFNKDFIAACAASKILFEARGLAIVEVLDTTRLIARQPANSDGSSEAPASSPSSKEPREEKSSPSKSLPICPLPVSAAPAAEKSSPSKSPPIGPSSSPVSAAPAADNVPLLGRDRPECAPVSQTRQSGGSNPSSKSQSTMATFRSSPKSKAMANSVMKPTGSNVTAKGPTTSRKQAAVYSRGNQRRGCFSQ